MATVAVLAGFAAAKGDPSLFFNSDTFTKSIPDTAPTPLKVERQDQKMEYSLESTDEFDLRDFALKPESIGWFVAGFGGVVLVALIRRRLATP